MVEDEEDLEPLAAALVREASIHRWPGRRPRVRALRAPELRPRPPRRDASRGDGRDVLRRIRETSRTPVVMLTARGEETDRARPRARRRRLHHEAVQRRELAARIRAVLRRSVEPEPESSRAPCSSTAGSAWTSTVREQGQRAARPDRQGVRARVLLERAGKLVRRAELVHEVGPPGSARRRPSTCT